MKNQIAIQPAHAAVLAFVTPGVRPVPLGFSISSTLSLSLSDSRLGHAAPLYTLIISIQPTDVMVCRIAFDSAIVAPPPPPKHPSCHSARCLAFSVEATIARLDAAQAGLTMPMSTCRCGTKEFVSGHLFCSTKRHYGKSHWSSRALILPIPPAPCKDWIKILYRNFFQQETVDMNAAVRSWWRSEPVGTPLSCRQAA